MKTMIIMILVFAISIFVVLGHGDKTFSEAEEIIKSKIHCDQLTDDQLEMLGDYYMEQMHPGEEHERMDSMMGGEGSDTLQEMHISMAQAFYCGEHDMMSGGMMDMMRGSSGNNRGKIMNGGFGMMGGTGMGLLWILYLIVGAFIVAIIFWWTYKLVMKEK